MNLSDQIKELAGKADIAFSEAMASVDRGERQDQIDEHRGFVAVTHDRLAQALMQHRTAIIEALEFQERLSTIQRYDIYASETCDCCGVTWSADADEDGEFIRYHELKGQSK